MGAVLLARGRYRESAAARGKGPPQYLGFSCPGAGGGGWTKWSVAGILSRPGRVSISISSARRRVSLRHMVRSDMSATIRRTVVGVQARAGAILAAQ